MTVKYKVSDFAKDLNISAKKVLDELNAMGSTGKKNSSTLEENELNYLLEKFSKDNSVKSLDEFLNSAKAPKAEPKPAEKKAEPKAEKKPEAPKAEPAKAEAKPAAKHDSKKNEQHKKREEKTVSLSELARETGAKATAASAQSVSVRREDNQVTVDTRTVDMNVDRFDARYDDLASTKNTENRRKPTPQGNKQKFTQRGQRQRQQFQKGKRETEFERLQRIQLEKARNAQLKVLIPDEITVGELAARLKQQAGKVIAKFMQMGEMHAINDIIDFDTAALVAEEFHAKVEKEVHVTIEERLFTQEEDSQDDLVTRPPVVCVMGHVDHGKTSILDAIRKTNVTAGEAGGITQAIGAYQVKVNDSLITFLDTPGHEAFTSMRARGANMTDIAVLVVAADDGIMPQTVESINHAKAANVKLIVAMNKMDKPTANPERVMEGLTKYGIITEDWGGDVACIPVSALTGMGINDLLERIALEAEVMELKANPNRRAKGAVVEARLDKGQGPIATILVQNGTLHSGDVIIAGTAVGRVRTMRSDKGILLNDAGPSTPVEITGLTAVPEAGDLFEAVEDERLARELAEQRIAAAKEKQFSSFQKVTLDNLFSQMAQNDMKELAIVVKADVQGSAEAVKQSLEKISNDEVRVRVIHAGVGAISKSDVDLADASNAIIIGFNVRPDNVAKEEAAATKVEMRMYRVIYDAINDVTDAMKGMLAPKFREVSLGELQVRQVYKISNVGTVAGCRVTSGKITRDSEPGELRSAVNDAGLPSRQRRLSFATISNQMMACVGLLMNDSCVGSDDLATLCQTAGAFGSRSSAASGRQPQRSNQFSKWKDERLAARELAEQRIAAAKEKQFSSFQKVTLDNLFSQMAQNDMKELAIVVKADVQGSAEAVKQSLEKISNDEVRVRVIHAGVGAISKSDVDLADASNAIIIGFNVRPDNVAKEEAAATKVEMRMYRVIYDAINDVTDAMKGMLAPKFREVSLGELQVRQVYKISNVGTVAGCRVTSGKITRDSKVRVVRDGIVITEDEIASLKRFKDDAKEVAEGYECGVTLAKFADVKEGDVYEAFKMEEYRD